MSPRGIFFEDLFLFMCVYMCLLACMYTFLQMYKGARKGQVDLQVVLCGCWRLNSGSLGAQQVLLTTEQSSSSYSLALEAKTPYVA